MSRGAKYYEAMWDQERHRVADLKKQLKVSNSRVLLLESKLLGMDFSLKNWFRQKIRKHNTQDIINYQQ